jgi:hypothetical protein
VRQIAFDCISFASQEKRPQTNVFPYRHIGGLNASLCNRTTGARPIASTSNRHGHSLARRFSKNIFAVRATNFCLSSVTLNSGNAVSSSRTVGVRTSKKASVSPSYPIMAISPLAHAGTQFRRPNT